MDGATDLPLLAAQSGVGGLGLGLGFFAVRWAAQFLAGRHDKREAFIDAGTDKLIAGLQSEVLRLTERLGEMMHRLDQVEAELAQCREQHADANAELKAMKAEIQARGSMRNEAQTLIATERMLDRQRARKEGGEA